MYSRIGRYILRYLVFMGIPYLLAKRLEKLVMNKLNPETIQILNKELKKNKFPEIENIAQPTRDGLDSRGGAVGPLGLWFVKTVVVDMAIKAAVVGGFWATIYGPAADSAASNLVKYAGAIVSAPGNKFKRFYKKLKGLNPDYHAEIREILLDKELTNSDKLALIKLKIEQAVKNLKGARRKKVILLLMATCF